MCAAVFTVAAAPLRLVYRSSKPQALSSSPLGVLSFSRAQWYGTRLWGGNGNSESWMLSRRRNLESPVPLAPMKAGSIATHASISPRFFFFPPFFPFPFFLFSFFFQLYRGGFVLQYSILFLKFMVGLFWVRGNGVVDTRAHLVAICLV